jgi:hypothetical protein
VVAANARGDLLTITWEGDVGRVNTTTGAYTLIGNSGATDTNALAVDGNGVVYASDASLLYRVDAASGQGTLLGNLHIGDVRDMAVGPDGFLYASVHHELSNGTPLADDLFQVNLSTLQGRLVGSTGAILVQGLAFSPTGTLYGWSKDLTTVNGMLITSAPGLVTLSLTTGAATDVNAAIDGITDIQGMAFDADGALYGVRDKLYLINPLTGGTMMVAASLPDIRAAVSMDAAGNVASPEPGSLALIGIPAAVWLRRGRRVRH